ncbi:hypothetical protein FDECE_15500 [Fusarium decemcellulare]|nr:hypothetical protein FDECE_15500 [Fusarium decemcellulare]
MSTSSPLGPKHLRLDKRRRTSPSKSSGRKAKAARLPRLQIPPVLDDDTVSEMDDMEDIPARLPNSDRDVLPEQTSPAPVSKTQERDSSRSLDKQASDAQESVSSFRPRCLGSNGHPQSSDNEAVPAPTQVRSTPPDEWMSLVPDGIMDDNSHEYRSARHHTTAAPPIAGPSAQAAFLGSVSPSRPSTHATLEASPTMKCQWDSIAASFNRSLMPGSDLKMTSESLREAVAGYATPVGPEPEAKLSLETVTVNIKVAVSCSCSVRSFHVLCDSADSRSIYARAAFRFKDHVRHGFYSVQFITADSGDPVAVDSVDEILGLGEETMWRPSWPALLRLVMREQLCLKIGEACRCFNEQMAGWLAAGLFWNSRTSGTFISRESYNDFFLVEDEVAERVCAMI